MDTSTALRTNASARDFTDEPVSHQTVHDILDDARFAPSGGNRQPWRVAVVEDQAVRHRIGELMQPVWDAYIARLPLGSTPYNVVDDIEPDEVPHAANPLIDAIATVPVVLAIAADLRRIAVMDSAVGRMPITGGASIYPFCWSILLAARARGLGGVLTTFLSRNEPAVAPDLGLPEHHALVATIFLGVPRTQLTKLKRAPVGTFATLDRFDGPTFTP
jgi:nitroreductase